MGVPGQAAGTPATGIAGTDGTPNGHGVAQPGRYLGHPCGHGEGRDAHRSCPGAEAGCE